MFSSLHAKQKYNHILCAAIDISFEHEFDFRVYYVPGAENFIADYLSHLHNDVASVALCLAPQLVISPFEPSWNVLWAAKK